MGREGDHSACRHSAIVVHGYCRPISCSKGSVNWKVSFSNDAYAYFGCSVSFENRDLCFLEIECDNCVCVCVCVCVSMKV